MDNKVKQAPNDENIGNPSNSKRKLILGLAAAPVAATLPTRFAWGRGNNCSISGLLSGNLSNQPDYQCRTANGKSPGFWKTHAGCWPVAVLIGKIKAPDGVNVVRQLSISDSPNLKCAYLQNGTANTNGKLLGNWQDYTYSDGISLSTLLSNASGQIVAGYNNTLIDYLANGPGFPKHVAAAMLSAHHPNTNYPYTPKEVADAVIYALNAGDEKVAKLTEILKQLQDGLGSADAPHLVTRVSC